MSGFDSSTGVSWSVSGAPGPASNSINGSMATITSSNGDTATQQVLKQ